MRCKVVLKNSDSGEFFSYGDITFTPDGFILLYQVGTDDAKIVFSNGKLTNERKGGVAIKMQFVCGEETLCSLGEGELFGEFPVFTRELDSEICESGVKLRLKYSLGEEIFILGLDVTVEK